MKESKAVIWPQERGYHKAVQIYAENSPFLVFGSSMDEMHGEILARFLEEHNITYTCVEIPGSVSTVTPCLEGDKYKVVGMGRPKVIPENKYMSAHGTSTDYIIRMNKEHLEKIQQLYPDWTILMYNI